MGNGGQLRRGCIASILVRWQGSTDLRVQLGTIRGVQLAWGSTRVPHVPAIEMGGGTLSLYRNAVLQGSFGSATGGATFGEFGSLGATQMQGKLAEIIIYTRTLSPSERATAHSVLAYQVRTLTHDNRL